MNKKPKSKNFTTEELCNLLNLIEKSPALTSKKTDAVTNMAKEAAWDKLAQRFNADKEGNRRDISQLKLKWDNLKKAAKKRATDINTRNRATGEGEGTEIIPDPILDRIITIIKLPTCVGPRNFDDDTDHINLEFTDCGLAFDAELASDAVHETVVDKMEVNNVPKTEMIPSAVRDSKWNSSLLKSPVNEKLKLEKRKILEEELMKSKIRKNNAIALYYEYKNRKTLEEELLKSKIRKDDAIASYYKYKSLNKNNEGCDSCSDE